MPSPLSAMHEPYSWAGMPLPRMPPLALALPPPAHVHAIARPDDKKCRRPWEQPDILAPPFVCILVEHDDENKKKAMTKKKRTDAIGCGCNSLGPISTSGNFCSWELLTRVKRILSNVGISLVGIFSARFVWVCGCRWDAAVSFWPRCGWGRYRKIPTGTKNSRHRYSMRSPIPCGACTHAGSSLARTELRQPSRYCRHLKPNHFSRADIVGIYKTEPLHSRAIIVGIYKTEPVGPSRYCRYWYNRATTAEPLL